MRFKKYIREQGGQAAGKLEVDSTPLEKAREFAEDGFELDKEIPNFDENYKKAQSISKLGKTKRKYMPVITDEDNVKFIDGQKWKEVQSRHLSK